MENIKYNGTEFEVSEPFEVEEKGMCRMITEVIPDEFGKRIYAIKPEIFFEELKEGQEKIL